MNNSNIISFFDNFNWFFDALHFAFKVFKLHIPFLHFDGFQHVDDFHVALFLLEKLHG